MTDTTKDALVEPIRRIRCWISDKTGDTPPDPLPEWVLFSDYEALAARLAEVEVEVERDTHSSAGNAVQETSENWRDRAEARVTALTEELAQARSVQSAAGVLARHLEASCGTVESAWAYVFRAMATYTQQDRQDDINALHTTLPTLTKGEKTDGTER
jgi:hypothetical protein